MFTQTFVDDTIATNKKPLTLAFSLILQGIVIGLLALIPLLYTQALPAAVFRSLLFVPVPPRAAAPQHRESKAPAKLLPRTLQLHQLYAPATVPKKIVALDQFASAPDIGIVGTGSDTNTVFGLGLSGVIGAAPGAPPPPESAAVPKKKSANGPVHVASVLQEANLVRKVMPVYPPLAKSARVQGMVEFTALISKEGRVENLQLVHGHPLLVQAAQEAIEQWRYRPTILNGVAVEVVTDIIVNFTLNQ